MAPGPCLVVEVTGLEPAASASRTQRSTKLSHTSSTQIIIPHKAIFVNNKFLKKCLTLPGVYDIITLAK